MLDEFVRFRGHEALTPTGFAEKNWCAEEWSHGCYGGACGPCSAGIAGGPGSRGTAHGMYAFSWSMGSRPVRSAVPVFVSWPVRCNEVSTVE